MSIQDNIKLNDSVFRAINAHDLDTYLSCFSDDAVIIAPSGPEALRGKEAVRATLQPFIEAFPDLKVVMKNQVVSEDQFAGEFEQNGTHNGPLQLAPDAPAIPATGKKMTALKGTFFSKIRNNKVVELHLYSDTAGLMMQLGLMAVAAGK